MKKKTRVITIRISEDVYQMTKQLGIKRSPLAEKIFMLECAARLQTVDTDIENLKQLASMRLQEEKFKNDYLRLAKEKIDQEDWIKTHQKEEIEKTRAALLQTFSLFCGDQNLKQSEFTAVLLGDIRSSRYEEYEISLIDILKRAGLPSDLNILREAITKNRIPQVIR